MPGMPQLSLRTVQMGLVYVRDGGLKKRFGCVGGECQTGISRRPGGKYLISIISSCCWSAIGNL